MNELIILFVLAFCIFISPFLARLARLPVAPVEIALGAFFGLAGLLPESELFSLTAKLGFYYLMFLAGMHIDWRELVATPRPTILFAASYLAFLYVVSGICAAFSHNPFFVFTLVSLMSVGMLGTLAKDYGASKPWLAVAMLTGCAGEAVSIVLITFAEAYVKFGLGARLAINIAYLAAFVLFCVLVFKGVEVLFWWFPKLARTLMPQYDKEEKDIRLSLALFLAVVAAMLWLGIEIAFGAFVAGSFIATFFSHKADLNRRLGSFGFGFLVPIFFVFVGSRLTWAALSDFDILKLAFLVVAFTIILRTVGALIFAREVPPKERALFGFSLSMPLTLLIAAATLGLEAAVIEQNTYFALILASVFEAVIVTSTINFICLRKS